MKPEILRAAVDRAPAGRTGALPGATGPTGATVLPAASEHTALFKPRSGSRRKDVRGVILPEWGGPSRTATAEAVRTATVEQALKHPNWSMGAKVTIDSATLMNKGLELIEA